METTNQGEASYAKMKDGTWGIRVVGFCPGSGSTIQVKKRGGEVKTERIKETVWSGVQDGKTISLCSIATSRPATSSNASRGSGGRGRGTRTGCSCGSVEEYTKASDCWSCKHDAE